MITHEEEQFILQKHYKMVFEGVKEKFGEVLEELASKKDVFISTSMKEHFPYWDRKEINKGILELDVIQEYENNRAYENAALLWSAMELIKEYFKISSLEYKEYRELSKKTIPTLEQLEPFARGLLKKYNEKNSFI